MSEFWKFPFHSVHIVLFVSVQQMIGTLTGYVKCSRDCRGRDGTATSSSDELMFECQFVRVTQIIVFEYFVSMRRVDPYSQTSSFCMMVNSPPPPKSKWIIWTTHHYSIILKLELERCLTDFSIFMLCILKLLSKTLLFLYPIKYISLSIC